MPARKNRSGGTSVGQAKSPARLERRSGGRPKSPPAGRAGTTADFAPMAIGAD